MADRSEVESGKMVPDNRSINDILQDILQNIERMVQSEIRLARAEVVQQVQGLRKASVYLGAAGMCGLLCAVCMTTACLAALTLVMPLWLAALLLGIGFGVVASGAFIIGRTRIEEIDLGPRRTVETLKDDLEWAKRDVP